MSKTKESKEFLNKLAGNDLFGCMGCKYTSYNKKDFQTIISDPWHYCKKCQKEIIKIFMKVKNE